MSLYSTWVQFKKSYRLQEEGGENITFITNKIDIIEYDI